MREIHEKFRGAMIGLGIGDALGMPTEFLTPQQIKYNYGKIAGYERANKGHPCGHLKRGSYTDDTQMAIRLSNAILNTKMKFNIKSIQKEFIKWYDEDDNRAPGCACVSAVANLKRGGIIKPSPNSAGNGSAMRVTPLALFTNDLKRSLLAAVKQSEITHGDNRAHEGSKIIALVLHNYIWNNRETTISEIMKEVISQDFMDRIFYTKSMVDKEFSMDQNEEVYSKIGTSGFVVDTVCAVLYTMWRFGHKPEVAMYIPANMGNDSDTISALVGTMIGAKYGLSVFPKELIDGLENVNILRNIADEFFQHHVSVGNIK